MSVYYNEHDLKAAAWLDMLSTCGEITPGDVDPRDIQKVRIDDLRDYDRCHFFAGIGGWDYALRLAGWPAGEPVWTASLPCQPFSAAGKQRGVEDERHLWPVFRDLVEQCRPPVVFGEQVASKPGRAWLASVQTDLEALGYSTAAADLCAAGVGAPHIRQRLYWVGIADGARSFEGRQAPETLGYGDTVEPASGVGGVAYLETGRRGQVHPVARGCGEGGRAQGGERPEHGGSAGGLAAPNGRHSGAEREQRSGEQRLQSPLRGDGSGVANSSSTGLEVECQQPAREERETVERGGAVGGLDIAEGNGREDGVAILGKHDRKSTFNGCLSSGLPNTESLSGWRDLAQREQEGGTTDRRNSAWDDVVYAPCADGKARPIKPGIEPLVDGLPGRVGLLRGYGNAIVPQVAAVFIRSVMEAVSC